MIGMTIPTKTDQKINARGIINSPLGGCVPGGSRCEPCDPGLAPIGADCQSADEWTILCHAQKPPCDSRGATSHSHGNANVPTQGGIVELSKNPSTTNNNNDNNNGKNQHDGNSNNDANVNKKGEAEKSSGSS
jgi:hypothetical protein